MIFMPCDNRVSDNQLKMPRDHFYTYTFHWIFIHFQNSLWFIDDGIEEKSKRKILKDNKRIPPCSGVFGCTFYQFSRWIHFCDLVLFSMAKIILFMFLSCFITQGEAINLASKIFPWLSQCPGGMISVHDFFLPHCSNQIFIALICNQPKWLGNSRTVFYCRCLYSIYISIHKWVQ